MQGLAVRSFKMNLCLMYILGLYSPKKRSKFFKVRAYLMYLILTASIPIFGTLYFIFEENISMTKVNNNAFLIAAVASQIAKLLPFVANSDRIRRCIHYFETISFSLTSKKHRKILNGYSRICRRNTMIFVVSIVSGNIFWATRPFFTNEQVLPVDVWLPWDLLSQSGAIFFVYFFLVIAVAYTSISCAAVDPLIAGLICLATGHLNILKDNLQYLQQYAEERKNESDSIKKLQINDFIYGIIKQCIDHHNSILNFIFEYEQCFTFAVFGQFLGSILVICFCCLQISKLEPLSYNFISNVTFLSVFMGQIYVYCYYGTMLFEESNSLTDAIYMGQWYEYDIKSKKALIILMERSKRPIIVTVGKVLNMSIETFMMILKRSYSLLAVLQNL